MKTLKVLACLAFLGISLAETSAQEDQAVILMFGDSITYGIPIVPREFRNPDDGQGDNFGPSVLGLEGLLNESRRNSLVLNWGYGGSNSAFGASRLGSSINTSKNLHTSLQYFVLIQYGTNDEGTISTTTTDASIRSMITTARNAGVTPILGNLTPRSDQSVNTRNNIISVIAQEMAVPLVDHNDTFTSFSTYFVLEPKFTDPDEFIYLHPNQMGYDMLARNWFNSDLQTLIEPTPLPAPPPRVIAPIIFLLLDDD